MPLTLRKATLQDSDLLLAWRNEPEAVANSTTQRAVTEAEHDRWIVKVLTDQTTHVYIAERWVGDYGATLPRDPEPAGQFMAVGMGRIDDEHGVAVLSYSIAQEWRGKKFGGELVLELTQQAHALGYRAISAVCWPRNTASVRALLGAGFHIEPQLLLQLRKDAV